MLGDMTGWGAHGDGGGELRGRRLFRLRAEAARRTDSVARHGSFHLPVLHRVRLGKCLGRRRVDRALYVVPAISELAITNTMAAHALLLLADGHHEQAVQAALDSLQFSHDICIGGTVIPYSVGVMTMNRQLQCSSVCAEKMHRPEYH